jgi:hypothetical protein
MRKGKEESNRNGEFFFWNWVLDDDKNKFMKNQWEFAWGPKIGAMEEMN